MYMPLTELEMSKRVTDSLAAFGVYNIRQLAALEAKKLAEIPGIAKADTKEIQSCLNSTGLSLGMRFIDSMFPSIL